MLTNRKIKLVTGFKNSPFSFTRMLQLLGMGAGVVPTFAAVQNWGPIWTQSTKQLMTQWVVEQNIKKRITSATLSARTQVQRTRSRNETLSTEPATTIPSEEMLLAIIVKAVASIVVTAR